MIFGLVWGGLLLGLVWSGTNPVVISGNLGLGCTATGCISALFAAVICYLGLGWTVAGVWSADIC